MIKLRASGKIATARRVVKKALAGSWSVKDFARGSRQFEVASNKVSMSAAEAWEATYRLRAQPGVEWAEPCFTVPLEAPARLRAKGRRASGGGGGPAPANPQWSVNMVKTREAWAFSTQTGNPAQGAGIVLGHPDTGCTTHSEVLSGTPTLIQPIQWIVELAAQFRRTSFASRATAPAHRASSSATTMRELRNSSLASRPQRS